MNIFLFNAELLSERQSSNDLKLGTWTLSLCLKKQKDVVKHYLYEENIDICWVQDTELESDYFITLCHFPVWTRNFFIRYKNWHLPEPTSSEVKRQSTNPAIQVQFSVAQQMDISFASVAEKICDFDLFRKFLCEHKKLSNAIYSESGLYTLSLSEREHSQNKSVLWHLTDVVI